MGNPLVPLVMFGWIPIVLYIFARFPAQRAVIISFIAAWLFLPMATYDIPGLPDYTKMTATCYGILLATVIFDIGKFATFRFSWIDIPMVLWCFAPFVSAMANGLGPYNGLSESLAQSIAWGLPYFLGRLYLSSFSGLRQLAVGIFIGGLLYIPFCLYESRMMVSLHTLLYGFETAGASFVMAMRLGGYRPTVFMEHGLMVGVWMMTATLMGLVLWRTGVLKKVWDVPIAWWVGALALTFVLVRSTGSYLLLMLALGMLLIAKHFRNSILIWVLAAGMGVYLYLGIAGDFPRRELIGTLSQVFPAERVQSVDFRFENEERLSAKARMQPVFGWGGFGRSRVYDEYGQDISITDSLWIIAFGMNGIFGVVTLFTALLLPSLAFCIRFPAKIWSHPSVAPAAALSVALAMYSLDCILNAMVNPVFALVCGGVAGVVVSQKQTSRAKTATPVYALNRSA